MNDARILIVDDEPSILATMAPLLRGAGYEVSTARPPTRRSRRWIVNRRS
jgi:CheY-like chemotaxis protein